MRAPHGVFVLGLLALGLALGAARPVGADAALGTSAWSLEIGTNVGSGDQDASFAIRRHSGASSAIRFGIEVDVEKFDGDGIRTTTGSPDEDVQQKADGTDIALSIQWMRFAPIRNNVAATFALGPVVQMERSAFRQSVGIGTPSFSDFEARQSSRMFGLDLGLGAEWFFNPRFSLGGQAGIRALMGTDNQISIQRTGTGPTYAKTETDVDVDRAEISTERARIQLTAYF